MTNAIGVKIDSFKRAHELAHTLDIRVLLNEVQSASDVSVLVAM